MSVAAQVELIKLREAVTALQRQMESAEAELAKLRMALVRAAKKDTP